MASYCPHCGAPSPDEARFCMKCGRERLPAPTEETPAAPQNPPPAAPQSPPPPSAAPQSPPPPPAAPQSPPPPPSPNSPPPPTAPSPLGAFFTRTFRGDWTGSLQAALWPVVLLLAGAAALATPAYGQDDDAVFGFTDRLRIALALLLQSVGGGFEFTGREERPDFGSGSGSDGLGLGTDTGMGSGPDSTTTAVEGTASLHLVPLTMTALWIVALYIGVRVLRNRLVTRGAAQSSATAGLEAAVRVALLVTVGVLALALFAQPEIEGVELSSSPVLAALGAFLLGLAVSGAVLLRVDTSLWARVTARPGAQTLIRATGTALRALVVVLVLCSVVAFISLAQVDDLSEITDLDDADISPLLVALLILPNLAVTALGIGWGASAEASVRGSSSMYGSGRDSGSFGLSELGDVTNDWAVVGALALGFVCALTLGVLAARRCVGRGEQLLAAGVFFGIVLLLAGFSGIGVEVSGQAFDSGSGFGGSSSGGGGGVETGLSIPETLLFGLLWIFPAALLGPYLLQMTGRQTAPPTPLTYAPLPAAPQTPPSQTPPSQVPPTPTSAAPTQTAATYTPPPSPPTHPAPQAPQAPQAFQPLQPLQPLQPHPAPTPAPAPTKPHNRATIWVVTIIVALVVGGGATAGALLWRDMGDDKAGNGDNTGKDNRPAVSRSEDPTGAPTSTPTDDPSNDPTRTPTPAASPNQAPEGTERITDPEGFSFAVPDGWTRQPVNPERPGQITYAGSTGREEFLVGVVADAPYTSYENFKNIEKHTKAAPDKSDYDRIRMEENTFQGRDGAIWEYTYTDEGGRTIHALNQSYVAENGTEYAIQLSWREDFWPGSEGAKTHGAALDTWRLTD
ncbi:zinc-ribbon domain-containing protein [Streptomyces venezuelae]|uniref:zinc-ribbon domain-containing protein n=1 Tax=Streptomyces venezuelae TaxID=54571 RepID=UPI003668408A